MKTETTKVTMLKSPLSGYWLIQGDNIKMIELGVRTKRAAYNNAKKYGYEHHISVNDDIIYLKPTNQQQ